MSALQTFSRKTGIELTGQLCFHPLQKEISFKMTEQILQAILILDLKIQDFWFVQKDLRFDGA